jgi:hypothetical protein
MRAISSSLAAMAGHAGARHGVRVAEGGDKEGAIGDLDTAMVGSFAHRAPPLANPCGSVTCMRNSGLADSLELSARLRWRMRYHTCHWRLSIDDVAETLLHRSVHERRDRLVPGGFRRWGQRAALPRRRRDARPDGCRAAARREGPLARGRAVRVTARSPEFGQSTRLYVVLRDPAAADVTCKPRGQVVRRDGHFRVVIRVGGAKRNTGRLEDRI